MKTMSILAAIAALTTVGFAAGPNWPPAPNERAKPRVHVVRTVTKTNCATMVIDAGGRDGRKVVSCDRFAGLRPADCRIACR